LRICPARGKRRTSKYAGDLKSEVNRGPIRDSEPHVSETALYAPVKAFLEGLGYACKGEIGGCDVVGLAGGDPQVVVIAELKATFNLELLLQAVDRARAGDEIWLAAKLARKGRHGDRRFRDLCRRLGFGMLGVGDDGRVELLLSPAALPPRRDAKRRSRLVEEHRRRRGDPHPGGGRGVAIMTAYRQRALACAHRMAEGPMRPRDLRPLAPDAGQILLCNVYGWFAPVSRGVYELTAAGRAALLRWPSAARDGGEEVVDRHVVGEPPLAP
jgi:hypothetical protein